MRILHVIPSVSPLRGGPSSAVLAMTGSLRQNGVHAEIAATNDDGDGVLKMPLEVPFDYQGAKVYFFSRFSPPVRFLREFAFSRSFCRWLGRNIGGYDLLHVHAIFSFTSTFAMYLARKRGKAYIVRPLGQLCEWSLRQSALRKKAYLAGIEYRNLSRSDSVHYTSVQEMNEAACLNISAPGFVLPHGLQMPPVLDGAREELRKNIGLPEDEPIVLFMSRIHEKKGLNHLIPALGRIKHLRFTFVMAGPADNDYGAKVDRMLEEAGLASRTIKPGMVKGRMKDLLLQGSDLFALVSHSENFGIAVVEALAAGLPVLISPGVALADEVLENKLGMVSDFDEARVAACVEALLTRQTDREDFRRRARGHVMQTYSWDTISMRLKEIYGRIIEQRSH